MKKVTLFALTIIVFAIYAKSTLAFELKVTASQEAGKVPLSVNFQCEPKYGASPYTYLWDFDDIDGYRNENRQQNPLHTFRFLGKHIVTVTVKDANGNEEQAVLVVYVSAADSIKTIDAVEDCNCDNTGNQDNTPILEKCINNNYSSAGLRIEFPEGVYRFNAAYSGTGSNQRYCGIYLYDRNLELVKKPSATSLPVLRYYGVVNSSKSWDCFIFARQSSTRYFLARGLNFQLNGDPDQYIRVQNLVGDGDTGYSYITIEECNINKFSKVGQFENSVIKRCNITGCGDFGGGNIEMLRPNKSLIKRNYMGDGDDGHSHFIYTSSGYSDFYIIENFADGKNQADSKWFAQLKSDSHDYKIMGNLVKNITSGLVTTGAYDKQAYNAVIRSNRLIAARSGVAVDSSSKNIDIVDNLFVDISSHILSAGSPGCKEGNLDAVGISLKNNTIGQSWAANNIIDYCDSCSYCVSNVVLTNNLSNDSYRLSVDPVGWANNSTYQDPGMWEFNPPINNKITFSGSGSNVTLNISSYDSESGMGAIARFPFKRGAAMQLSNNAKTWSEVRPFSTTTTWNIENSGIVYARFRDRDGNWSDAVASSVATISNPVPGDAVIASPRNLRIIDNGLN